MRDAIPEETATGRPPAGERAIQEQIAPALGGSRPPVPQALLLRDPGVLREAGGRGLVVAPLDADEVQHRYELRAVIEGLAARRAAEGAADRAAKQGPAVIDAGRKAVSSGAVPRSAAADRRFHEFVDELSGNPLVAPAMAAQRTCTERVMAEAPTRDETPRDIRNQHAAVIDAIAAGDAGCTDALARAQVTPAAAFMIARRPSVGKPTPQPPASG